MPSFVLLCCPGNSRRIIADADLVSKFLLLALKPKIQHHLRHQVNTCIHFVSASCDLRACTVWPNWTQPKFFFRVGLPDESLVWFDVLVSPCPSNMPIPHLFLTPGKVVSWGAKLLVPFICLAFLRSSGEVSVVWSKKTSIWVIFRIHIKWSNVRTTCSQAEMFFVCPSSADTSLSHRHELLYAKPEYLTSIT